MPPITSTPTLVLRKIFVSEQPGSEPRKESGTTTSRVSHRRNKTGLNSTITYLRFSVEGNGVELQGTPKQGFRIGRKERRKRKKGLERGIRFRRRRKILFM